MRPKKQQNVYQALRSTKDEEEEMRGYYIIFEVHYPDYREKGKPWGIEQVKVQLIIDDRPKGSPEIMSVQNVIEKIKGKMFFYTIRKGERWKKSQLVDVVPEGERREHIKSLPNGNPKDNLENLPEF